MGRSRDAETTNTASDVVGLVHWSLVGLGIFAFVLVWLPHPLAMNSGWSMKLLQQSEPAAVREESTIPLAGAAEQIASGYFKSESWLRPLTDRMHVGPHSVTVMIALVLTLLGMLWAWHRVKRKSPYPWGRPAGSFRYFLYDGWHWDQVLWKVFVYPCRQLGHALQRLDRWLWDGLIHFFVRLARAVAYSERQFDERLIDGLVNQSAQLTQGSGLMLRQLQTGNLRFYLILLLATAVLAGSIIVGISWWMMRGL